MQKQRGYAVVGIVVIALWLAAAGGWIANIVKFIGMLDGGVTTMFIARCAGIVIAPLGMVLGYF